MSSSTDAVSVVAGGERLVDQAYRQIRDAIVAVRLQPGAPLDEKALSASLGLGLTPIRDALKRLTAYDFPGNIQPVLEALEEHVILLRLLGEATSPSTVTVRIGSEVPYEGLGGTAVVATGYGPGDQAFGTLGIVGPTRMDYPGTMGSVRAVARYLSKILDEG